MINIFKRTFDGLKKTRNKLVNTFSKLHGKKYLNDDEINDLEDILYQSDLGLDLVERIINSFKNITLSNNENWEDKFLELIKKNIRYNKNINCDDYEIILVVGVNGTGKTTTSAKLANHYKNKGNKVYLVGADTFRAAAVEQLKVWAEKINVKYISNPNTKDPASIVFDGIKSGLKDSCDKIIIDTAGRLHNSINLMQELKKIYNICQKFEKKVNVVLTIDSNVGQNGINQALDFNRYIPINSLILTKMDGTARGGIAISLINKLDLDVDFIGIGENIEDLIPFDLDIFLKGLIKNE
tara:strand:+ start:2065 stop:2955 length:891 start_codon:yes stop_codon:yes gene_type:complete